MIYVDAWVRPRAELRQMAGLEGERASAMRPAVTQPRIIWTVGHSTRALEELLALLRANRITVLAEGSMLAEGTPGEIGANEAVQAAYLGKTAA